MMYSSDDDGEYRDQRKQQDMAYMLSSDQPDTH